MNGKISIWKSSADISLNSNGGTTRSEMETTKKLQKGYKWIGERRYHEGNPKYLYPNDDGEFERLRRNHFIAREVLGSDFKAPIRNPLEASIRVLDAGCGSGIWCTEMAQEFPESHFFGTDIAQPYPVAPPRNTVFKQSNTLEGLPFSDNSFNYVFQRAATFCFTDKEWPKIINELARVTKEGGWIELVEYEYILKNANSKMIEYMNKLEMALSVRGINVKFCTTILPEILQIPGFRNISYNSYPSPIGGETELGKENLKSFELALTSMSPRMCAVMGIRSEELDAMIVDMLENFDDCEATMNIHVVYGMKPMNVKFPGSGTKST